MPLSFMSELLIQYKYAVMALLIPFGQPLVGMTAGLLARLGYLDIVAVYVLLIVVSVLGDIAWYWVGHRWGGGFVGRFGKYVSVTPEHIESVKHLFHRYHAVILLASKITNGFGFAIAVLFTAGLTRVPLGRFIVLNIIGESIWSAIIVSVGYFFGEAYLQVNDVLGKVFLAVFFAVFVLLVLGFSNFMRNRIEKQAQNL